MESRKEKQQRRLSNLENYKKSVEDNLIYSSNRFDILLVTFSSSMLVLSVNFYYKIETEELINIFYIKSGWLLLLSCLISNLLSQVSSFYANKYDLKGTINQIRRTRNYPSKYNENVDKMCKIFNKATFILNLISLTSLIIGLVLILLFLIINL